MARWKVGVRTPVKCMGAGCDPVALLLEIGDGSNCSSISAQGSEERKQPDASPGEVALMLTNLLKAASAGVLDAAADAGD